MPTIFIFHGIQGHPAENWFPWLKTQLEKKGYHVIVPAFPHPDKPLLDEWMKHMKQYEKDIDEHTIFIGHSLGAGFALRWMERMSQHIQAAFFIAPAWCIMGNPFDPLMTTFTIGSYNWAAIKQHCSNIHIIQSDNDPYVASSLAEELGKYLNVKPMIIRNAGHFNEKAGYTTFPLLLEKVMALMNETD